MAGTTPAVAYPYGRRRQRLALSHLDLGWGRMGWQLVQCAIVQRGLSEAEARRNRLGISR